MNDIIKKLCLQWSGRPEEYYTPPDHVITVPDCSGLAVVIWTEGVKMCGIVDIKKEKWDIEPREL